MKTKYITKTLIEDVFFEELDMVFADEFERDFKNDEQFEFIIPKQGLYADGDLANIDAFIKILQESKEKGATHVEMSVNSDHYGYDISAYNIRLSTPEEIEAFQISIGNQKEKTKQEQIASLKKQLELLTKSQE